MVERGNALSSFVACLFHFISCYMTLLQYSSPIIFLLRVLPEMTLIREDCGRR